MSTIVFTADHNTVPVRHIGNKTKKTKVAKIPVHFPYFF